MNASAAPRVGPLVSIVTPTKDRAELLEWTLRSVRRQTYPNLEHVVVDAGSTDGTVSLLQRYEDTYDLRWPSEVDHGMYYGINHGMRLARGQILAYLNSDDLYFPWTVEVIVDTFRRRQDADFVYGDALAIDDQTGRQSLYWLPPFNLDYIRRSGFLAQPTVFWRRAAYEDEGPFDESLRYVADCDYWMRAGARHRFVKINEFLAIERNHANTLRSSVGGPLWAELAQVRSRYVSLDGPEHTRRVARHDRRRRWWERLYKLGLLAQAFVPRQLRRGPWSHLLNSGIVHVERLRFVLRATQVGKRLPGLRRIATGDFLRPDPSLLQPP